MGSVNFLPPIAEMTGRLSKRDKDGTVFRRKHYRDDNGNIIGVAKKEHFLVTRPRNYRTNPMSEAEAKAVDAFKYAVQQYNIEKENPERMAYWKKRFKAQLRKPDSHAPIDPKTRRPRVYCRLDMFIRAMLQVSFQQL